MKIIYVTSLFFPNPTKTANVSEGQKPINSQGWKTLQSGYFLRTNMLVDIIPPGYQYSEVFFTAINCH